MSRHLAPRALVSLHGLAASVLAICDPALAQVPAFSITPAGSSVTINTYAHIDSTCSPPPDTVTTSVGVFTPGLLGSAFGAAMQAHTKHVGTCEIGANAEGLVLVYQGSPSVVSMTWIVLDNDKHSCYCHPPDVYTGLGTTGLSATVPLTIVGVPATTQVTIRYSWRLITINNHRPEALGDDLNSISASLTVNGVPVVSPPAMDLVDVRGWANRADIVGPITAHGGDVINLVVGGSGSALMRNPGNGFLQSDAELVELYGQLVIWCSTVTGALPTCPGDPTLGFSLDIGSDSELSDPNHTGNEFFDPGDLYTWHAPLLLGPANGSRDDATMLGYDPAPYTTLPHFAAPTCQNQNIPDIRDGYFDLDDGDSIDRSIRFLPGYNVMAPFPAPITSAVYGASSCIHEANFLFISYDDDGPWHYTSTAAGCQVPVTSFSPYEPQFFGVTHGSAGGADEVLGLTLTPRFPPATPGYDWAASPFLDEAGVHPNLAPDPNIDGTNPGVDDDVDALDFTGGNCPIWMFTVDHEATAGFLPGFVCEAMGFGAGVVLQHTVHLGLPDGVDIKGLEFVWTGGVPGNLGSRLLTLLFTAAPDDPATAEDESGGLDPRKIYGSYMTGTYFEVTPDPLPDAIDAITAWCSPMAAPPTSSLFCDDFEAPDATALFPCVTAGCIGDEGWGLWYQGGQTGEISFAHAHSGAKSLRLHPGSDIVQAADIRVLDTYEITGWTYFPSAAAGAPNTAYFIVMNRYNQPALGPDNWSIQIKFDGAASTVSNDYGVESMALVRDAWVPIRAVIDLVADRYDFYYNGVRLVTQDNYSTNSGVGRRAIACIDLYSGGTDEFYYDDICVNIPCYANCDGSVTPPVLNVLDFACFVNRYAAGDPWANCDHSTTPPVLNVLDFACFLNKVAAGCP